MRRKGAGSRGGREEISRSAFGALLDLASQLFNFFRFFYQGERQGGGGIGFFDLLLQLRREFKQLFDIPLDVLLVVLEHGFGRRLSGKIRVFFATGAGGIPARRRKRLLGTREPSERRKGRRGG